VIEDGSGRSIGCDESALVEREGLERGVGAVGNEGPRALGAHEEIGDGGVGERGTPRSLDGRPALVRAAWVPAVARTRAEEASGGRSRLVEAVDDVCQRQLAGRDGEHEAAARATCAGDDPDLGQRVEGLREIVRRRTGRASDLVGAHRAAGLGLREHQYRSQCVVGR